MGHWPASDGPWWASNGHGRLRSASETPEPGGRLAGVGNLWARVGPTHDDSASPVAWMVFLPDGFLLGIVHLPRVEVMEIGED